MTTDVQLKKDVEAELEWDPSIDASRIGVAVQDSVVTLSGHLGRFAEKSAAERAAKRVAGVRGVAVELDVRLEPHHRMSDAEIGAAVHAAFQWHALIPGERIHFTVEKDVLVEGGTATLRGTVNAWQERDVVQHAALSAAGIQRVVNALKIVP